MADKRAIGVFDSGLGGLTVIKELRRILPNEDIIYFGDTGRVPYGTKSRDTIIKYASQDEKFLLSKNVKLIIAACGTVSSVASQEAEKLPVPFFEVVSHAANEAAKLTLNKKIGVLGTNATVKSGKHAEFIKKILPEAEIISCGCSMFVPLVEEGWHSADDIVVLETVKRYLKPVIASGADTVILGCTHYPVLKDAIRSVVGAGVNLVNAGTSTSKAVYKYLSENSLLNDKDTKGDAQFFVSDKPDSFRKIASILLGEEIDEKKVEQVDISNYD